MPNRPAKPIPSQETLKKHFVYNPDTGEFFRLPSMRRTGSVCGAGYYMIGFDNYVYYAHHFAVVYMTGKMPSDGRVIDHADGNKLNNSWSNLRVCQHRLNIANSRKRANSTQQYKGVGKTPKGRFQARIKCDGKRLYLGTFDTPAEANKAYMEAAARLFGQFARAA